MEHLTKLESSAALKKYIVCNASVAASVTHLLYSILDREDLHASHRRGDAMNPSANIVAIRYRNMYEE